MAKARLVPGPRRVGGGTSRWWTSPSIRSKGIFHSQKSGDRRGAGQDTRLQKENVWSKRKEKEKEGKRKEQTSQATEAESPSIPVETTCDRRPLW